MTDLCIRFTVSDDKGLFDVVFEGGFCPSARERREIAQVLAPLGTSDWVEMMSDRLRVAISPYAETAVGRLLIAERLKTYLLTDHVYERVRVAIDV